MNQHLTRRHLARAAVGGATTLAVATAVTTSTATATATASAPADTAATTHPADAGPAPQTVEPFRGEHQSGIVTTAQERLLFAAFDVVTTDRSALRTLLATWTGAAEQLTRGCLLTAKAPAAHPRAPTDTGEAVGENTGRLTITIGHGRSLFDRFGLVDRRPALLDPLPAFRLDALDPSTSDGDLGVQVCGDDPQVNHHAVRNLARLGHGVVVLRWVQTGFGRTASTSAAQATPRNLMGFKDGTRNVVSAETEALERQVWADDSSRQPWMVGGSYLVARKIRMNLAKWDGDDLDDQEDTFGRFKRSGAPFTGSAEFDPPDLVARRPDGALVIPPTAHVRLAAHETNQGVRILRRGYNYTDGETGGALDSGLFFLAYMRDPRQFVTLQSRLAAADDLNAYISHISSALFAVPAGLAAGVDWGTQLFG